MPHLPSTKGVSTAVLCEDPGHEEPLLASKPSLPTESWLKASFCTTEIDLQASSVATFEVDPQILLVDMLRHADDSDRWEDAQLGACLEYAWSSKFLQVPEEFQEVAYSYMKAFH